MFSNHGASAEGGAVHYPDREELEVAEAVVVTCLQNHRSPRKVVEVINFLGLNRQTIEACSPLEGDLPVMRVWSTEGQLQRLTLAAVQACLDAGHALKDIVVISWRGVGHSAFKDGTLGPHRLIRFTGTYSEGGEPLWTDGDLVFETLKRAKGQSAAAVVFTEIDFEVLTDVVRNSLFVGMTRARMRLELVLSARAEAALLATT
ncbi:MAG: hypothetical protein RL722_1077 [Pseudomonadota bacterium]|jgi:hypothetical protein